MVFHEQFSQLQSSMILLGILLGSLTQETGEMWSSSYVRWLEENVLWTWIPDLVLTGAMDFFLVNLWLIYG